MAERGAAAPGGVLPVPGILVHPRERESDAPGQHHVMAYQILEASWPAAHQRPRFPAYNGLYALLQWRGQCVHFKALGPCPGVHHRKYLRPRHGGSRPAERRYPGRRIFEKGLNFGAS